MLPGTRAYPKPGKSTKRKRSLMVKKFNDCVRPGVEDVRASPRTESRELIRLDLTTFERQRKAISRLESRGQSASAEALLRNSALKRPRTFTDERGLDPCTSVIIRGLLSFKLVAGSGCGLRGVPLFPD